MKNGTYPSYDESLLDEIPEDFKIFKTKTFEPYQLLNYIVGTPKKNYAVGLMGFEADKSLIKRLSLYIRANFFIPDARVGWKYFAYPAAKKIIADHNIKAVITTGPPHSTHLTGLKLKKKVNIPWIADMRDPWVNIYYNRIFPRSKRTINKDRRLETKVLKNADLLTVVSEGLQKEFSDRANRISTILNGFDAIDMPQDIFTEAVDRFSISYIGNFKPNQNIKMIWRALAELKEEIPGFAKDMIIRLTGNIDPTILQSIKQHNLYDNLEQKQYVPHKEATQLMSQSSVLLFVVPKTTNNSLIITGKLFEYIATSTPVVSVGPTEGDAAKILSDAQRDSMCDYDEKERFKDKIKGYYENWKMNGQVAYRHSKSSLEKYSRKSQTKRLSLELNRITNE
ncbi:MAG: glycosyltransferase [Bacteroidales bacterium]|nr:glycosyltransferase [Bacteroidales bacterium]